MSRPKGGRRNRQEQRRAGDGGASGLSNRGGGYWRESQGPLASLFLLLPLILLYELGPALIHPNAAQSSRAQVIAFLLLQKFFGLFGAVRSWMPALAIASILLAQHVLRNEPWILRLPVIAGMTVEGIVLAVPVFLLGITLPNLFPLAGGLERADCWNRILISVGAGLYEELVFRLILLTLLSMLLKDLFRLRPTLAAVIGVVVSGLLFSAYHYLGRDELPFRIEPFTFRLAGIYFGGLFLTRGFGITAFSHAIYDVFVLVLAGIGT